MDFDFDSRFEKLSGIVHRVDSEAGAAQKIDEICQGQKCECLALAGLNSSLQSRIESLCKDISILKEPYVPETVVSDIDRADVGVTGISFAIAQSGTMVEISTNDTTRLVSGLPRTYIGVFTSDTIIDKYNDSATRIRQITRDNPENLVISFISGPSRTGDIELKLTLGVHGPEEAHAIIINSTSD